MKKDKISIALTKSLINQINDKCKKTGLSRSSFIEMILRRHCQAQLLNHEQRRFQLFPTIEELLEHMETSRTRIIGNG